MMAPRAHNAFQKNMIIYNEERARLASFINPHYEYSVQQQAGPVNNVWPTPPAPWNITQPQDHGATTFMPPPTKLTPAQLKEFLEAEDHHVPTVVEPNLTPTTELQEEEQKHIVHVDATSTTVLRTSLREHHQGPGWSIPADTQYWNEMMNIGQSAPTNDAKDTMSPEEEFDADAYIASLLNDE